MAHQTSCRSAGNCFVQKRGDWFRAECPGCGWSGETRRERVKASADANNHRGKAGYCLIFQNDPRGYGRYARV